LTIKIHNSTEKAHLPPLEASLEQIAAI